MKELIERRKIIRELKVDIDRHDLIGFRSQETAEKAALLDALAERMSRSIDELEDLGVEVKDLEFGLIDFPAEKHGELVSLCWRYGESEVAFWHREDEGFAGRRPLKADQLISR